MLSDTLLWYLYNRCPKKLYLRLHYETLRLEVLFCCPNHPVLDNITLHWSVGWLCNNDVTHWWALNQQNKQWRHQFSWGSCRNKSINNKTLSHAITLTVLVASQYRVVKVVSGSIFRLQKIPTFRTKSPKASVSDSVLVHVHTAMRRAPCVKIQLCVYA